MGQIRMKGFSNLPSQGQDVPFRAPLGRRRRLPLGPVVPDSPPTP